MGSNRPNPDVVIVGAGVIGLTTGIRLAESNVQVRLYADRRGPGTCSFAAGAIFDPFLARHTRRAAWAEATVGAFERLHADGQPWVRFLSGVEASRTPIPTPDSARRLPGFSQCGPGELRKDFVAGWRYRAPLVDMPPYLKWLERRLEGLGGEIRTRRLETLDEGFDDTDVVINCSGIGARELVPDGSMQPIRGQVVVIRNPGIDEFFVEHIPDADLRDTTYLLPQGDMLVLGGNAEKGELDRTADDEVAAGILRRCTDAFPELEGAEVVGNRVGVRPQRPAVRLEHQGMGTHHIVHNYGHGGSGVSLSWGCADEVTDIVCGLIGVPGLDGKR